MKYVLHFYASCKSMKDVKTSIIAKIHNDELTYGVSGASKSDQIREPAGTTGPMSSPAM